MSTLTQNPDWPVDADGPADYKYDCEQYLVKTKKGLSNQFEMKLTSSSNEAYFIVK